MLNIKSKKSLFLMFVVGLMGISTMQARLLTPDELARFNACFAPQRWADMSTEDLSQLTWDGFQMYRSLFRRIECQEKKSLFKALMVDLGVGIEGLE